MGEWVWNVDLEGKSQIQAGELEKEVTVTIPFTMDITLHNLRIDGEGYIEIDSPLHIFFLQLHNDYTLKLRYRDKYGERKLADLGKYTPNSHISMTYHLVEEEAEGRLKINIDGRETTLKVLPIYEKTHHTQIDIVSVYTGRAFPIEQFFKLHGSITIKITSEQPPPEQPTPPKTTRSTYLLTHYLEDAYAFSEFSIAKKWKYGKELVMCGSYGTGTRVYKLLNSIYAVEYNGSIYGWATPEELDRIVEKVLEKYGYSFHKKSSKEYIGFVDPIKHKEYNFTWRTTEYYVNDYVDLETREEIRKQIFSQLHKNPITNEKPRIYDLSLRTASIKITPDKKTYKPGEPINLEIYISMYEPIPYPCQLKALIGYAKYEPNVIGPYRIDQLDKIIDRFNISLPQTNKRSSFTVKRTVKITNPGTYYLQACISSVDDCWLCNGTQITVSEQPPSKPTPPPQPPKQPKPPTPPTKPTPPSLDIKSIEIRTTKTEYLPNEQIPITILIKLTEPADDKYPIYLKIWMVDPYGLQKPLKNTTIYTEKGKDQVKCSLNLALTTTGVYIIYVDAKLDDKPEHTTQKMIRVVMKPSKPPAPPTPPPEKPTPTPPTPPPEQPPTKPPEKPSTETMKKIAIIGGTIAGIMAIWKLFKKKK